MLISFYDSFTKLQFLEFSFHTSAFKHNISALVLVLKVILDSRFNFDSSCSSKSYLLNFRVDFYLAIALFKLNYLSILDLLTYLEANFVVF